MAATGLLSRIADAAAKIDLGRKGFATRGKEQEGRISYELGISQNGKKMKKSDISCSRTPPLDKGMKWAIP